MFIQKLKIIVPDEVNMLTCRTNQYCLTFRSHEINRLNRKITIYREFYFSREDGNPFDLCLFYNDYGGRGLQYSFDIPIEYYVSKLECEITFNKLNEEFVFTINGEKYDN